MIQHICRGLFLGYLTMILNCKSYVISKLTDIVYDVDLLKI